MLVFLVYSIVQATLSFSDQKSSPRLIMESKIKGTIARGFYVIDAQTKLPVASSSVSVMLVGDDDIDRRKAFVVSTKLSDENGWVMFDGLEPNVSIAKATEKKQSNHYIVIADAPFECQHHYGSITMSLSEPGLYDSENIEVSPGGEEAGCKIEIFVNQKYGFEFQYPENYKIGGLTNEGTPIKDAFGVSYQYFVMDSPVSAVAIFIPQSDDSAHMNPNAKSLDDYKKNYKTKGSYPFNVVIESSEDVVINSISALKQVYSASREGDDLQGAEHTTRYVFFDGKDKFVILRGDEIVLRKIVSTFKFIRQ